MAGLRPHPPLHGAREAHSWAWSPGHPPFHAEKHSSAHRRPSAPRGPSPRCRRDAAARRAPAGGRREASIDLPSVPVTRLRRRLRPRAGGHPAGAGAVEEVGLGDHGLRGALGARGRGEARRAVRAPEPVRRRGDGLPRSRGGAHGPRQVRQGVAGGPHRHLQLRAVPDHRRVPRLRGAPDVRGAGRLRRVGALPVRQVHCR
jgi:hypothetical protein